MTRIGEWIMSPFDRPPRLPEGDPPVAPMNYTMTLRRRGDDYDRVDPFTRGFDFDEVVATDRMLLDWLIAAVRRAGYDPKEDLDEFDLQIREAGEWDVLYTFAASSREVAD